MWREHSATSVSEVVAGFRDLVGGRDEPLLIAQRSQLGFFKTILKVCFPGCSEEYSIRGQS